jgi:hypothetical protein
MITYYRRGFIDVLLANLVISSGLLAGARVVVIVGILPEFAEPTPDHTICVAALC